MTVVDDAERYARLGLRVVPIPPGQKRPAIQAWQDRASTDTATIHRWFDDRLDWNIGLALGQITPTKWLFAIDIDGPSHGVEGEEAWRDLVADQPLPETWESLTGGGGRHLLFWSPFEVRNGVLAEGVDVRGAGGQIVVEPSLHPSGQPYSWCDQHEPWASRAARAPDWLLELLRRDPKEHVTDVEERSTPAGERPGDIWAATVTWNQLLEADGWTLHHTDRRTGEQHWTRPGKERRDGTSATVGYGGSDVLKIFTSSMTAAGLQPEETYTKLGYLAATRHHGDHQAAARALADAGHKPPDIDLQLLAGTHTAPTPPPEGAELEQAQFAAADWCRVDLTDIAVGLIEAPRPTLLQPAGAPHALIYPGRVNSLFGESGAGKTWVALAALRDVLLAGDTAVLIDLEDSSHGIVARLQALGVPTATLIDRFVYIAPETAWRPDAALALRHELDRAQPTLVVVDSTGEAMAASGVKGNDDDDVARWFATFPKAIARLGPAVLIIDHVPKDPNAPTGYAIGSQRKRAAVNGAAYRIDAVKAPSRDDDGLLKIITAKDRHGWHTQGRMACVVHVTHVPGDDERVDVTLALEEPSTTEDGGFRPTHLMERVSRWIETHPNQSKRIVLAEVTGKDSYLRDALAALIAEGYVTETTAQRGFTYRSGTPYREDDEALDTLAGDTAAHRGPPRPESAGPRSPETAAPAPSPSGAGPRSAGPKATPETTTAAPTAAQPSFPTDTDEEF